MAMRVAYNLSANSWVFLCWPKYNSVYRDYLNACKNILFYLKSIEICPVNLDRGVINI